MGLSGGMVSRPLEIVVVAAIKDADDDDELSGEDLLEESV